MFLSSISNTRLHCCLLILILALIIFLSLPLLLIWITSEHYEKAIEQELKKPLNFDLDKLNVATVNCREFARNANLSTVPDRVQCPTGSFACKLCPEICILQEQQCDQVPDCPDHSDETLCIDYTGHLESFYSKISPHVAQTHSQNMESSENVVYDIPKSCSNKEVWDQVCKCNLSETEIVYCERHGLTEVPLLPDTVWKLHLNNNMIGDIEQVRWPEALGSVNLENNLLTRISGASFATARNLSKILLTNNQISHIDLEAFANAPNLVKLYIDRNRLTTFDTRLIERNRNLRGLYASDNQIDLPQETSFGEGKFPALEELYFDHNQITLIRRHYFRNISSLEVLALQNNKIAHIEPGAFDFNFKLLELNLIANNLKHLDRTMFARSLSIRRLRLGSNPLGSLPADLFREMLELESLDLQGVDLDNSTITRATFSYLTKLKYIQFTKFRYCHFAPHVRVCKPLTDGLSSSRELLAFPILKSAVWIVALVCIVGNSLVFIWRSLSPHEDQTLSLFVRNLSLADLLMGLYLATIGLADAHFERRFKLFAIDWMSSWTCTAVGFLAMVSSELSVFILTIITMERYRSIVTIRRSEPAEQRRRARLQVLLAWTLALSIAAWPLLESYLRQTDYYATNALCLPLHIDQPYTPGYLYSALVYLGVNFLAVVVIMALYVRMYCIVIDWRKRSRPQSLDKHEDSILAARFFFIVLTDCLCWIPIVVIKLLALCRIDISSSIYGWLVVFIIPINSALNPIVYTLAAPTSLRDAVCRWFERLCLKLDRLAASSPNGTSPSGESSLSTGCGQSAGERARNSNSTITCDMQDNSLAKSELGRQLESEGASWPSEPTKMASLLTLPLAPTGNDLAKRQPEGLRASCRRYLALGNGDDGGKRDLKKRKMIAFTGNQTRIASTNDEAHKYPAAANSRGQQSTGEYVRVAAQQAGDSRRTGRSFLRLPRGGHCSDTGGGIPRPFNRSRQADL